MQSQNFEFLREKFPLLSDLGALAEAVIYTDLGSATTRLRSFAEEVVEIYLGKNGFNIFIFIKLKIKLTLILTPTTSII